MPEVNSQNTEVQQIRGLNAAAEEIESSENVEAIKSKWGSFLDAVDHGLKSAAEAVREAAKNVVLNTLELLEGFSQSQEIIALKEDLDILLQTAADSMVFLEKLSSYSPSQLKMFFERNLQAPELPPEQKNRLAVLEIAFTSLNAYRDIIAELHTDESYNLDRTILSAALDRTDKMLVGLQEATSLVINGATVTLTDAANSVFNDFRDPPGIFSQITVPFPPISLEEPQSENDVDFQRANAIAALREIKAYSAAESIAMQSFPKETAKAELTHSELSEIRGRVEVPATVELYSEYKKAIQRAKPGQPLPERLPEKAEAMLQATIKALGDRAVEDARASFVFKGMNVAAMSPGQRAVFEQMNDMGDYQNELFNMADSNIDLTKKITLEVGMLVATIVLPEMAGTWIMNGVRMSAETIQILRSARMVKFAEKIWSAESVMKAVRGADAIKTVVIGQVGGEVIYKAVRIATGEDAMKDTFNTSDLSGYQWLVELSISLICEGVPEFRSIMRGIEITTAKEIARSLKSTALCLVADAFIDSGNMDLCVQFFANAFKNGDLSASDPAKLKLLVDFCGPELYEMCGYTMPA